MLWNCPALWNAGGVSGVQSVERAFAILRCLAGGPAGVSEVAERVALPKSTVSRLLSTLHVLGAVEQAGAGNEYRIGETMFDITSGARPGRSLIAAARPHLVELVEALQEVAGLSVLDVGDVVYLDQVAADHQVQVRDWTGERIPAHMVSSGLVLLAHMSDPELTRYLERPLEASTEHTITDPEALRRRLAAISADGYVWTRDEYVPGVSSVAAPIFDSADRVVGAVHVHGPSYRFPEPGRVDGIADSVIDGGAADVSRFSGESPLERGQCRRSQGGPRRLAGTVGIDIDLAASTVPTVYWHALDDGRVQCDVCPRACKLREGQRGCASCGRVEGDEIVLTTYGRSSGFCVDPIEKKPLNHFLPGHAGAVVRHGRAATWPAASARTGTSPSRRRSTRSPTPRRPETIADAAAARSAAAAWRSPTTTR